MEQAERSDDAPLDLLWGGEAIAQALKLKKRRSVYGMLEAGTIPARKIGKVWVASRAKLKEHFEQVSA